MEINLGFLFMRLTGVEMNGIQNRKGQNIEKFPGCLGRSLFDLNTGAPGNRLVTDKPHSDGDFLFMKKLVFFFYLFRYFEV